MKELTPEVVAQVCREDYATFCQVMQDEGWFDPIHREICEGIQAELQRTGNLAALRTGEDKYSLEVCKIGIVLPRGTLKSTIITKYLPAWLALQNPNVTNLIAGNTQPNAAKKVDNIRSLYDSHEAYRALFPQTLPDAKCKWTSTMAVIPRTGSFPEGTYESAGRKTQITGRHYNCIIEDDTIAPQKEDIGSDMALPSMEDVEQGIGFHRMCIPLQVPKGVRIRVVVTTRWCDYDLIAYIQKNERYKIFNYPALKSDGKPNFSIFYGNEELEEIKKTLGSYMFAALFLNDPIPAGERLFRPDWFHSYKEDQIPLSTDLNPVNYWVSIDPAISKRDEACDTAIIGCFHTGSLVYVHDVIRGKLAPMELVVRAVNLLEKNRALYRCGILIETVAYQKALVYFLNDELKRRRMNVQIVENNSRTSKEVRIASLQPLYESGQILHRKGIDEALETQLIQFPHGRLVDLPDCLAQHMAVYRGVYVKEELPPEEAVGGFYAAYLEIKNKKAGRGFTSPYDPSVSRIAGKLVGELI